MEFVTELTTSVTLPKSIFLKESLRAIKNEFENQQIKVRKSMSQ